jgi:SAM-dependent methyltransferase
VTGGELLAKLASVAPGEREAAVERLLGLTEGDAPPSAPPGPDMVGYHASGVAPIVRALVEARVGPADVVIDLGAGLGKVTLLARLLTGATVRGIEAQLPLVARAREAAARLGAEVSYVHEDARTADISDGTVFFLYLPFTGSVLAQVVERLREVAARRAIVVCALGVDLDRLAPWLVRRPGDSFWLAVYDSAAPGVAARCVESRGALDGALAGLVACERAG